MEKVIYDEEGMPVRVPAKYEVCYGCQGRGSSSAYMGALTRDDFEYEGPEFEQDYFDGHYDRECDVCHGARVVLDYAYDRFTDEQRALVDEHESSLAAMHAETLAEMRAGC